MESPFQIAQRQLQNVADALRDRRRPGQSPRPVQEVGRGLDPDDDGRRLRPELHRLAGDPQRRPRPVEGRDPLPPGRQSRRDQGALDVDDLEVRADEPPVRRRQGRRDLRPEDALAGRARADDPALHLGDRQRDRPGEGHPGSGCRHEPGDHGVDLRHVLDEQGLLGAERRHGQAARDRRLARPGGGDRPRRLLLARGDAHAPRGRDRRAQDRDPGLRQCRLAVREVRLRRRRHDRRRLRLGWRARRRERPRCRCSAGTQGTRRPDVGVRRRRGRLERGAARDRLRRARARARSSSCSPRPTRAA